ncbi:MAG: lanthionine synthetase LanC family protein [Bacteroidia bacterium]
MEKEAFLILNRELDLIYKNLISHTKEDSFGVFWISDNRDNYPKFSENIYSGSSGILLFLIEYYNLRKDTNALDIIRKSADWLEHYCKSNHSKNNAFYTGRVGTVYALVRARILLDDKKGVQRSIFLLKDLDFKLYSQKSCFDFLNGLAGTVLGLLHIYDLKKIQSLKTLILEATKILVEHIQVTNQGFFWDKTGRMIQPLCGFSHGVSGISFVFLELGRYFNNSFFYEIARRGMDFENTFFNSHKNNWPDFRKGCFSEEEVAQHINEHIRGNIGFFETPAYMEAWCHGSPGIALTRLRAYELLKDESYMERAVSIMNNLRLDKKSAFGSSTWCHGFLGNSILFYESAKVDKNAPYYRSFVQNCLLSIDVKNKSGYYKSGLNYEKGENKSLFLGIAGIGYSYIQALCTSDLFSPLLPSLNSHSEEKLETSIIHDFVLGNCEKRFPFTINSISSSIRKNVFSFKDLNSTRLNISIEELIYKSPKIKEIYDVELLKNTKEISIKNFALLNVRKLVNYHYFSLGRNRSFENISISLNPQVEILRIGNKTVILYPNVTDYKLTEIDNQIKELLMNLKVKKDLNTFVSKLKVKRPFEIIEYFIKESIIIVENEN